MRTRSIGRVRLSRISVLRCRDPFNPGWLNTTVSNNWPEVSDLSFRHEYNLVVFGAGMPAFGYSSGRGEANVEFDQVGWERAVWPMRSRQFRVLDIGSSIFNSSIRPECLDWRLWSHQWRFVPKARWGRCESRPQVYLLILFWPSEGPTMHVRNVWFYDCNTLEHLLSSCSLDTAGTEQFSKSWCLTSSWLC